MSGLRPQLVDMLSMRCGLVHAVVKMVLDRPSKYLHFSMTQLKVDRFLFSHKKYLIIWFVSEACKVVYT